MVRKRCLPLLAVLESRARLTGGLRAYSPIMVLVFGAFVLGGDHVIKLFGVGLAAAILLDALIVRSILVPALMIAVGKVQLGAPRRPGPLAPPPQRRRRRRRTGSHRDDTAGSGDPASSRAGNQLTKRPALSRRQPRPLARAQVVVEERGQERHE